MCINSGLAKRMLLRSDFRFLNVFGRKIHQNSPLRSSILFESPKVIYRPRSHSPLHFNKVTYSKLVRKNKMLTLGVCFPQPCPSVGRRFVASRSRLDYYGTIGSFPQKRIRWNALKTGFCWIRTCVSTKPNPTLRCLCVCVALLLLNRYWGIVTVTVRFVFHLFLK